MVTLAVVIVVMLGLLIGFHSRRAYWCLNVYKGPSPGREDDIGERTGTGMYAVMLRYAEFMMEVEKQREAGGMTIDQMVDEAKNNPDKTVYFEKGRLVYVSSGIMLEDLEVRDGRADYAGWGKRMDKRFGQSLGWDFGGYGEQGNGGSSAGKIMAGALLLGATTSELPPVAAAVVVGGTIIAGGAYIYDNWDGIVDGVTTAGESISDVWNWIKGEKDHLKGGKQGQRDRDFGIKDKDFNNWWHREGKKSYGKDYDGRGIYDEWIRLGRPKGPKPR